MGSNRFFCVGGGRYILYPAPMDELEITVRAALKIKWMSNDHDINLKRMVEFYRTTPEKLKGIITQYESELIATKFNIIE